MQSIPSYSVQEIQFSGPTYQIKIGGANQEEVWTFIQLGSDAFCSCEEEEACAHLALAFKSLFDQEGAPIHERFRSSFWYALGKIWFHRYGIRGKGSGFQLTSHSGEGMRLLQLLQGERLLETEENSIKFSNLSEEELEKWRRGEPSEELLFELSGWADFTKQLFLYKNSLEITFKEEALLPHRLLIDSFDFTIKSRLDEKDWISLIPVLNTIASPLRTFNELKDQCNSIVYDKKRECLRLDLKELPHVEGIDVGEWIYQKGTGFYPRRKRLTASISGDAIEPFLEQYRKEIPHLPPIDLTYTLAFDSEWNLTIKPNFVPKWGKWLYIPDKGFVSLKKINRFPDKIEEKDVADFIQNEKEWLNEQSGFTLHLGSLEAINSFHIDNQGALHFEKRFSHEKAKTKEFGSWIYVQGEGFFNKVYTPVTFPIPFNAPLKRDLVPSFLRRHAQELTQIPGFIASWPLFESVGIEIGLDEKERIWIEPRFTLKSKFKDHPFLLYEEWAYIEGEGFFELPHSQRLPEPLLSPVWIPKEKTNEFIEKELSSLEKWVQKIDPRLIPPLSIRLMLDHLEETPSHSWKIGVYYQTDRGIIPFNKIVEGMKKKKKYLLLKEGRLDLSDERFHWVRRLNGELTLSLIELIRLHAFEEIGVNKEISSLFYEVMDLKRIPPFHCEELKSTLRPYQKIGAEWLFSLYNYLLGGLLCDEMGLGKTHQAMALLAAIRTLKPKGTFLVACPTSVLYHWEDKLAEFFPTLRAHVHHGTFRKQRFEEEFDLFLTSYGVLRRDIGWISKHTFDAAIFDEIQVAKNHRSKLYHGLQKVLAKVKIGLTGTPLENRLRELKTLFDLVLPGYMPHESDYNKLIVRPIEKGHDMMKKGLLQRLTRPFVMRRRKIDVLRDLPEKTETVSHCELSQEQDQLYREALLVQGSDLLQEIVDVKKAIPFVHVFSLLSRLKQICDHPALFLKDTMRFEKYHSGKWELFVELLQEARESEQKVVVYSQYLGMLDIIENYLKKEGIGFASLRGSTRDRKEQIALFADDPLCEVFVASLKAAGLGIDLTSASVVIHYDRWWNAARENQATDRVHRFGQSKGVQVFKLVTKHTFEERIDQIIERKQHLLDESIAFDDHEVMKSFTREELFELLQYT